MTSFWGGEGGLILLGGVFCNGGGSLWGQKLYIFRGKMVVIHPPPRPKTIVLGWEWRLWW